MVSKYCQYRSLLVSTDSGLTFFQKVPEVERVRRVLATAIPEAHC